jgi:hypothetical protein
VNSNVVVSSAQQGGVVRLVEDALSDGIAMPEPADHNRTDYDDRLGSPVEPIPPVESQAAQPSRPSRIGNLIAVAIGIALPLGCLALLLYPVCSPLIQHAERKQNSNNLKQIGLAIHNYNQFQGRLPENSYGPDGTPLLSWRVHILPYLEYDPLFRQFNLSEPWDSPTNLPLLKMVPPPYSRPKEAYTGSLTYYRAFSSKGAVFERRPGGGAPFSLDSVKDGLANTIFVVEAAEAVEWTKPDDLDASLGKPFPRMGGLKLRGKVFGVLFGDGSVRHLKLDTPEDELRAMISHSGGESVRPD